KRLGEASHGELGRTVCPLPGDSTQARRTGHIDQMAITRGDQVWQKGFRAVDDAPEVDVHHPLDCLERHDFEITGEPDAGYVVELINSTEVCRDVVCIVAKALPVRDVKNVH